MKNSVQEPAHNDFHSRLDGATLGRLALAAKGVLVKQVLGQLVVLSIHAWQVGDVVTQFLDGLHLLVQVVALQKVTQLQGRTTK